MLTQSVTKGLSSLQWNSFSTGNLLLLTRHCSIQIITYARYADGSHGCGWSGFFYLHLSVSPSVLTHLKNVAAKANKLDTEMAQDVSWKPINFGSKCQRSRSRVAKTLPAWGLCTLVSAGFFYRRSQHSQACTDPRRQRFCVLCRNENYKS